MSGDLTALTTIWPTLSAYATTAQKLAALNVLQVPSAPRDVPLKQFEDYIESNGLLAPIVSYAQTGTNVTAKIACNYLFAILSSPYPNIGTSNPTTYASLLELGPGLLADPATGVSVQNLADMMAMVTPPIPWWEANGFDGGVTINDLIAAGNLF